MPSLPTTAQILINGFAEQRESALMRTEMESGPPKQARVKSRVMVTRPVVLRFDTRADYLAFIVWYRDTIHEGADWFDFIDPVTNTTRSGRFTGSIEAAPAGIMSGLWLVKGLKLEAWGD